MTSIVILVLGVTTLALGAASIFQTRSINSLRQCIDIHEKRLNDMVGIETPERGKQ